MAQARTRALPVQPRKSSLRLTAEDVIFLVGLNGVLIVGMWLRHGGLDNLQSPGQAFTALGQITALLGTYGAVVQLVLMSRGPWLEERFGLDGLAYYHRLLGFTSVWLILLHVFFSTVGWAIGDHLSFLGEGWTLLTTYAFMLPAAAATGLFILIAVTSMRAARHGMKYETWRFVHLYAYLAIALALGHELAVGSDLAGDPLARWYWIALLAAALITLLAFRLVAPLRLSLRHRLRVAKVIREGPDVVSLYLTGNGLEQLGARAGQYFRWRFLVPDGWWKTHPYSLSARPNRQFLRLTVKAVGDGSRELQQIKPGTAVSVEGPYGLFTSLRRTRPKALLIAGGIGITPLRALVEEMPGRRDSLALIYRASRWEDVIFKDELDDIIRGRGGVIHYLVGRRGSPEMPDDPLSAKPLRSLVPDIQQRDVYVCGPTGMMLRVDEVLQQLGLTEEQIHFERFALL